MGRSRAFRIALASFGMATPALAAETLPVGRPGLSLEQFVPPIGSGVAAIPTARTLDMLDYSLDFFLDYAKSPLTVMGGKAIVAHQVTGQLRAALGLGPVEVGLGLPMTLFQRTDFADAQHTFNAVALGDLRLGVKGRMTPADSMIGAALDLESSFPTGGGDHFSSEPGADLLGRLVFDLNAGAFSLDTFGGYRYRTTAVRYVNLYLFDELVAGGGVSYAVLPERLSLFAQTWLAWGLHGDPAVPGKEPTRNEMPFEALFGARVDLPQGFRATLGAGPGLTIGYGTPTFRAVLALGYTSPHRSAPVPPEMAPRPEREAQPKRLPPPPLPPPPAVPKLEAPAPRENIVQRVTVTKERVEIEEKIQFDTDSAKIKTESYALLKRLAEVMNEHSELKKVLIAGHTDERGGAGYNRELSLERAKSVKRFLTNYGVESDRLAARGFGFDMPLVPDAKTDDEHEKNRRVEFEILQRR